MHAKTQRMQSILFCACVVFFVCVRFGFMYLFRMTSMRCVDCVAYGSLETEAKSVSKLPYATQWTQHMLVMQRR